MSMFLRGFSTKCKLNIAAPKRKNFGAVLISEFLKIKFIKRSVAEECVKVINECGMSKIIFL